MARRSLEDIGAAFQAEYQKEEQKVQAESSNGLEAKDSSQTVGEEIKKDLTATEKAIERELESNAEDIKRVASKEQKEKQDFKTEPSKAVGSVGTVDRIEEPATTKTTAVSTTAVKTTAPTVAGTKANVLDTVGAKTKAATPAKENAAAERRLAQETLKKRTEVAKNKLEEEMRSEEEKERKKGVKMSRISDVIFYGSLVLMLVCVILYTRTAPGNRSFGGSTVHKVTTTAMESVYPKGSLVTIKEADPKDIAVGDDIAFSRNSGNLMIQRVLEVLENHNDTGAPLFITGNIDSDEGSREAVSPVEIAGKVTDQVSKTGALVAWIAGNPWIVMVLFLGLMALSFYIKMLGRRKIAKDKETVKKAEKKKKRKEM